MCMCVFVWGYVCVYVGCIRVLWGYKHMSSSAHRGPRGWSPGAGVTGICSLMLVLGIDLVCLGKAVFTLNHWAIFPAHTPRTFKTLLLKVFYPFPFLLPVLLTYTHLRSLKFIASFSLVPKCIKTTRSICIYHFKTDHLVSENQLGLSPKEGCFSCS